MQPNLVDYLSAFGSILSGIVALAALSYSLYQFKTSSNFLAKQTAAQDSLKKYEIKRDYQTKIQVWFANTTELLIYLRFLLVNKPEEYSEKKTHLLAMLSTQIELARLYFPNIDKQDGFGIEKPKAFQGYRILTLDFLVFSFNIFLKKDAALYEKHLYRLQREFTSIVCEILDPINFLNETKVHSDKFFSHNLSYEEFLNKDPNNIDLFFPRQPS